MLKIIPIGRKYGVIDTEIELVLRTLDSHREAEEWRVQAQG